MARADAASKQNYLIDFAPPYAPDQQNLWLAILYSSSVLVATLAVFGIGSLVVGQARGLEHDNQKWIRGWVIMICLFKSLEHFDPV